jgi:hypothetical protein
MFHSIGIYVTNTPLRNIFINLALLEGMELLSVHFIFLKDKDISDFTENEYESNYVTGGK